MKATRLAGELEGKTLSCWKVTKMLPPPTTGGCFSFQYVVENEEGEDYLLKALNFFDTFVQLGQDLGALVQLMETYTHEKAMLEVCEKGRMKNVVRAEDAGVYKELDNVMPVPYLVFAVAKEGDLRDYLPKVQDDFLLRIHLFKEAVKGLAQMHQADMAHQDVKPSNLLVFSADHAKICDLGRATTPDSALFNHDSHMGDPGYQPIELKYKHYEENWHIRRLSADLFMLGDLGIFTLFDTSYLTCLLSELHPDHKPERWGLGYREVLPYVERAHSTVVEAIVNLSPPSVKDEVRKLLETLCCPDPVKRVEIGNNSSSNRHSLRKVISLIDLIYRKYKYEPC